jgi:hypothetical protein
VAKVWFTVNQQLLFNHEFARIFTNKKKQKLSHTETQRHGGLSPEMAHATARIIVRRISQDPAQFADWGSSLEAKHDLAPVHCVHSSRKGAKKQKKKHKIKTISQEELEGPMPMRDSLPMRGSAVMQPSSAPQWGVLRRALLFKQA